LRAVQKQKSPRRYGKNRTEKITGKIQASWGMETIGERGVSSTERQGVIIRGKTVLIEKYGREIFLVKCVCDSERDVKTGRGTRPVFSWGGRTLGQRKELTGGTDRAGKKKTLKSRKKEWQGNKNAANL